jgi:hypothetical protein
MQDPQTTIQNSGICTTRGVPFVPRNTDRSAGFKSHKERVRQEMEAAYGEHSTGQERYQRQRRRRA